MTTTAFDDQFTTATQTVELVRQPYSTEAILKRNVADLEIALKQQTERAGAAEAELEAVREDNHSMMLEIHNLRIELEQKPLLYAINRILGEEVHPLSVDGQRALLQSVPQAPAVPAEIIELSKKYAIDTEAYHAAMDALLQSTEATK